MPMKVEFCEVAFLPNEANKSFVFLSYLWPIPGITEASLGRICHSGAPKQGREGYM